MRRALPRPRRTLVALVALGAACACATTAAGGAPDPPFAATVRALGAAERAAMTPAAWRPGCPVHPRALRVLALRHRDFAGRVRTGRLVVHNDVAREVVGIFRFLYAAGVPIRRMVPVERFGGDDDRSTRADNTSAFNCRTVAGTDRWSQHAFGRAIDINPRENPYVHAGGRVADPAARPFVRRRPARPGMAVEGGPLVRAFDRAGWSWGGRWHGDLDHQHFSRDGG